MPIGKDNKFDKESDQKTNRREFKVVIVRICVFIKSKEENLFLDLYVELLHISNSDVILLE